MPIRSLVVLAVLSPLAPAQSLVRDFNAELVADGSFGCNPTAPMPLATGEVVTSLDDVSRGRELWISDGTVGGSELLWESAPGSDDGAFGEFLALPSGVVIFASETEAYGREVYRTDGTPAGTGLLVDANPDPFDFPPGGFMLAGSDAYFWELTTGLWRTDGTSAGTSFVGGLVYASSLSSIQGRPGAGTTAGDLLFSAISGDQAGLWKTDGTPGGTQLVTTLGSGAAYRPRFFVPLDHRVLFQRNQLNLYDAWVTDGTAAGTFALGVDSANEFLVAGPVAYFSGEGDGYEPWVTDGTVAGTYQIADLAPATAIAPSSHPSWIGALGSSAIFSAADDGMDRDLWITDGTQAGTVKLSEVGVAFDFEANQGAWLGGFLYFSGDDGVDAGLWRTDGTAAGTSFVHPVVPSDLLSHAGSLFFVGTDELAKRELWSSDGTAAGTQRAWFLGAAGETQGSFDNFLGILARHGDRALLFGHDDAHGIEFWTTDGTTAGTELLVDSRPGPLSPLAHQAVSCERFAFLASYVADDGDPWISDGTPAGTTRLDVSSVHPSFLTPTNEFELPVAFRDRVVFVASVAGEGAEPWITDGTLAGTDSILDVAPGPDGSAPRDLFATEDRVYFVATVGSGGPEPWVTDGTAAGTFQLADTATPVNAGLDDPRWTVFGDHVYFVTGADAAGGAELWRTDGTAAGTGPFLDVAPGPVSSFPRSLLALRDRLLVVAVGPSGTFVVTTDGTIGGSLIVPLPFVPGFVPQPLLRVNDDEALFVLESGLPDLQVAWRVNSTLTSVDAVGQTHFELAWPGDFANPTEDLLLAAVDGPGTGTETWISDGTAAGTVQLFDLHPGDARPEQYLRLGNEVLFLADDGVHGRELFSFPLSLMGDEAVESFGTGCSGTGGVVPTLALEGEANASSPVPFELVVEGTLPSAAVFLHWSNERSAVPVLGCWTWAGPAPYVTVLASDATGRAVLPVQPNPAMAFERYVAQAFPLDPVGPAYGIASATPGLEIVLGP